MFLDAWIVEALAAAVRKDHQVEMDPNRDHPVHETECGRVLRPVNWTAQENHSANLCPRMVGHHRHAAAVTVSKKVEPSEIVLADPDVELCPTQSARCYAVTAGPLEAVLSAVQVWVTSA